jgi:hypothetical protein
MNYRRRAENPKGSFALGENPWRTKARGWKNFV